LAHDRLAEFDELAPLGVAPIVSSVPRAPPPWSGRSLSRRSRHRGEHTEPPSASSRDGGSSTGYRRYRHQVGSITRGKAWRQVDEVVCE
jgi:hypothetical protein